MTILKFDRLLELMRKGAISDCLAIVTSTDPDDVFILNFRDRVCEYFPAVMLCKLGEGKRSSLPAESTELALVYGLEHCDPLGGEAHAVRSNLDLRKYSGSASIICLSHAAHKKHFRDHKSPFFLFCDTVDQDTISDLGN